MPLISRGSLKCPACICQELEEEMYRSSDAVGAERQTKSESWRIMGLVAFRRGVRFDLARLRGRRASSKRRPARRVARAEGVQPGWSVAQSNYRVTTMGFAIDFRDRH